MDTHITRKGFLSNPSDMELICNETYGNQNKYLESSKGFEKKINDILIEQRIIFPINTGNRICFNINSNSEENYKGVLDSFESMGEIFIENENDIQYIEIVIGGSSVDKINDCDIELLKLLRDIYCMEGIPFEILKKGVPFLNHNEIQILIEFKTKRDHSKIPLKVNIYNNEKNIGLACGEFYISALNYTGVEKIRNKENKIRLGLVLPSTKLLIKTEDNSTPTHLELHINKHHTWILHLDHFETKYNYGIYNFVNDIRSHNDCIKHNVNFSMVDNAKLVFNTNHNKTLVVKIYSIGLTSIRYVSGMCGLMHTK